MNGIDFEDLKEFNKFVYDLKLIGSVQLKESVRDKKGNILIKDSIPVKESALKKLESIPGQFDPIFKVAMTNDLVNSIKKALTQEALPGIQKNKNEFTTILYSHDQSSIVSVENMINSSFYSTPLVLALYKIMLEHYEFFQHMISMAVLCLGTVVQKSYQIRLIHRYAFLTGLFADIAFFKTEFWKNSNLDDTNMLKIAKMSSQISQNIVMPAQVTSAIQSHIVPGMYVIEKPTPMDFELLNTNPFLQAQEIENKSEEINPADTENFDEALIILTEALKITRFISETYKRLSGAENIAEKLLIMFTYNVEKKFFNQELANPMIARFKEYEKIVKRTRKIAELENRCIKPPSAWAYPKPKATQILCKNKEYTCPHYVAGWDINVVSSQESVGYVGTSLRPGSYPKCKLEKELGEVAE